MSSTTIVNRMPPSGASHTVIKDHDPIGRDRVSTGVASAFNCKLLAGLKFLAKDKLSDVYFFTVCDEEKV